MPAASKSTAPKKAKVAPRTRSRAFRLAVWGVPAIAVVALVITTAVWVVELRGAYASTRTDLQALQADAGSGLNLASLTTDAARRDHNDFVELQQDLDKLNRLTRLPAPISWTIHRSHYLGSRYDADRQLLASARQLSSGGATLTGVAVESLTALDNAGFTAKSGAAAPTWLDILYQRQGDIRTGASQIQAASSQIAAIDLSLLPGSARGRVPELAAALGKLDLASMTEKMLPGIFTALGATGPVNYLVLIQNSEELRPSGGFPGTVALVTFDRGQLSSYTFFDVYDLNGAYVASDHTPIPQPWPLATYAPTGELSMLDATWWANFPTSAATEMAMYARTGWPPIAGVIAFDPAFVGQLLAITGPTTIELDGEQRTIDSQNFLDEIERERRLAMSGERPELAHKELVSLVGKDVIAKLQGADRQTLKQVGDILSQAADRRDVQAYASDPGVEHLLDQHRWSGLLVPDPGTPTVAVAMGNIAFGKSSQLMQPGYSFNVTNVAGGQQQVTLRIDLHHTGSVDPTDPFSSFYEGTQRWWIGVTLPAGATLVNSSTAAAPDPAAPGGGAYVVELDPGQRASLTVTFDMPATGRLLVRRQPGLQPADLSVTAPGCAAPVQRTLNVDQMFNLAGCG